MHVAGYYLTSSLFCIFTILDAIQSPNILFITDSLILASLVVKLVIESPLHLLPVSSICSPYRNIFISGRHDTGSIRFLSYKFMICFTIFAIITLCMLQRWSGIMLDALSMIGPEIHGIMLGSPSCL